MTPGTRPSELADEGASHVVNVTLFGANAEQYEGLVNAISLLVYGGDEPFGEVVVIGHRLTANGPSTSMPEEG